MAKRIPLIEWVEERLENCERIAKLKPVKEHQGWREDADCFRQILDILKNIRDLYS